MASNRPRKPVGSEPESQRAQARRSNLSQHFLEGKGVRGTNTQLQQELETLQQVHASIKSLHHMTVILHKTLQSVVENNNRLKDLNEGWSLFFGQNSR